MMMTKDYETRVMIVAILPCNAPIFSERVTEVHLCDESGGEYLELRQPACDLAGTVVIEPREWPAIRAAIDQMIDACRDDSTGVQSVPALGGREHW